MDFNSEEHIARLIFLYIQGNISEEEAKEIAAWRAASPSHEALFRQIVSYNHQTQSIRRFVKTPEENQRNWQALYAKMHPKPARALKHLWAYAALIALFLSCGGIMLYHLSDRNSLAGTPLTAGKLSSESSHPILILPNGEHIDLNSAKAETMANASMTITKDSVNYRSGTPADSKETYHTLRVPRGSEYILRLSDNTFVHLNAASELTYPEKFTGQQRKVYLKGEAYFKVQKSLEMPFIVMANRIEVKVMGTTFGVRAYEEEKEIRTTLESGKVTVNTKEHQIELSPGEQALFDKQTSGLDIREVDTDLYLGWKDNRIIYDNCPLETILRDLGRWYVFEVCYEKPEFRSYRFSLNIKRHESIEQVLKLIENAENIHFEMKDHQLLVR